jgi:hypothetical protein
MRAAIDGRVSSDTQTVDNQLLELHTYLALRQWTLADEIRDEGVSGSKDRRPAVDRLMTEARRGKVDVICVPAWQSRGKPATHKAPAAWPRGDDGIAEGPITLRVASMCARSSVG